MDFKFLFRASCYYAVHSQNISPSSIQRKFNVGYNDANKVIEILEELKIIGQYENKSQRKVNIKTISDMENILDLIYK